MELVNRMPTMLPSLAELPDIIEDIFQPHFNPAPTYGQWALERNLSRSSETFSPTELATVANLWGLPPNRVAPTQQVNLNKIADNGALYSMLGAMAASHNRCLANQLRTLLSMGTYASLTAKTPLLGTRYHSPNHNTHHITRYTRARHSNILHKLQHLQSYLYAHMILPLGFDPFDPRLHSPTTDYLPGGDNVSPYLFTTYTWHDRPQHFTGEAIFHHNRYRWFNIPDETPEFDALSTFHSGKRARKNLIVSRYRRSSYGTLIPVFLPLFEEPLVRVTLHLPPEITNVVKPRNISFTIPFTCLPTLYDPQTRLDYVDRAFNNLRNTNNLLGAIKQNYTTFWSTPLEQMLRPLTLAEFCYLMEYHPGATIIENID